MLVKVAEEVTDEVVLRKFCRLLGFPPNLKRWVCGLYLLRLAAQYIYFVDCYENLRYGSLRGVMVGAACKGPRVVQE